MIIQRHLVWVWQGGSIAPAAVNPRLPHAHKYLKFSMHMFHDQMHEKHPRTQNLSQTESRSFWLLLPFWRISIPRTLTSSYTFNTTVFTLSLYHPQTFKMKGYLSSTSHLVGVTEWSISHKHHPIYITFKGCFLHIILYKITYISAPALRWCHSPVYVEGVPVHCCSQL